MSVAAIQAGKAFVAIGILDQTAAGLNRVTARLNVFRDRVEAKGRELTTMGGALAAPLLFGAKSFMDFDNVMRSVAAKSVGGTAAGFAKLTAQAKELGRTTAFTAVQVAELMEVLAMAGFNQSEISEMTPAVLNLSRATKTDAPTSAGVLAATMRQFDLDATQATRVADRLTAAANGSFNDLRTIGDSLKYAGPVAREFNLSLEDSLALVAGLGNLGIQGSMAGTTLRNLQLRAAAMSDTFRSRLGVETKDASNNLRNLIDILGDLDKATAHMGNADRAEVFVDLMGIRSITGGSALAGNAIGLEELRKAIGGSDNLAANTTKDMDAGIGGVYLRLVSGLEGLNLMIGEKLDPLLTRWGNSITKMVEKATKWISRNAGLVESLAKLAATLIGVGTALLALGGIARITAMVASLTSTLVTGTAALARFLIGLGPAGLGLAAVAAVGIALLSREISRMNAQLERTRRLSLQLQSSRDRKQAELLAYVDEVQENPDAKFALNNVRRFHSDQVPTRRLVDDEISRVQREMEGLKRQRDAQEIAREQAANKLGGVAGGAAELLGMTPFAEHDQAIESTTQHLESLSDYLDELKKRAEQLAITPDAPPTTPTPPTPPTPPPSPLPFVATSLPSALEFGSMEAATAAWQNKQNSLLARLVSEAEAQGANINRAATTLDDIARQLNLD